MRLSILSPVSRMTPNWGKQLMLAGMQGCDSGGLQWAGMLCQKEPHKVYPRQRQNPAPGMKWPFAPGQAGDWITGK